MGPFCNGSGQQQLSQQEVEGNERERLAAERDEWEREVIPGIGDDPGDEKRVEEDHDVPEPPASEIDPSEDDSIEYACGVCLENVTEAEITRLEACGHYLCTPCMKRTIDHNINNGQWEMTCHDQGDGDDIDKCTHAITRPEVERIASPKELVLYRNKMQEKERQDAGAVFCPNPHPIHPDGCGNWVYPEEDTCCMRCNPERVPKADLDPERRAECNPCKSKGWISNTRMQCSFCKYAFCSECRVTVADDDEKGDAIITRPADWHVDMTCEVFQVINAAMAGGASQVKRCPGFLRSGRRCPEMIQKNGACNHMTCELGCKHEFCWTCLHPHTKNRIPEPNAVGPCTGCGSCLCGTERRIVWPREGPVTRDNVGDRDWRLMENYRRSQRRNAF